MKNYRNRLEIPGKMHICPNTPCNQKTFTRYIDTHTGKYIHESVGMCSRKDKCGYHYPPHKYFSENPDMKSKVVITPGNIPGEINELEQLTPTYVDPILLKQTLKNFDSNNFVLFLKTILPEDIVRKLIGLYHLGTARNNRTIFWQIDKDNKIRGGKIILYNKHTGKRVKDLPGAYSWVHKELQLQPFKLVQCFFGERLLNKYPHKPIAIFESEKTAIIATAFFPDFICLATGGKDGLNRDKCKALVGREVYLFPDINAYESWSEKAKEFKHLIKFTVSDFLEKNCTDLEREEGLDVADYLIRPLQKKNEIPNILNEPTHPTPSTQNGRILPVLSYDDTSEATPNSVGAPTPSTPSGGIGSPANQGEGKKAEISSNYKLEILPNYRKSAHQSLLLLPLRNIKFLLSCPEDRSVNINFYLLFGLITAASQKEIIELFSDKPYTPKDEFMGKLPDIWCLKELKSDGFSLIKKGTYSVYVYYQTKEPIYNIHNGLMYFSIPLGNFKTEDSIDEAIEKLKSLQNVVLVYSQKQEYLKFLKDGGKGDFYGHIHLMVYFGKLPDVPGISIDSIDYYCLAGYIELWALYAKYLKQNIDLAVFDDNPSYGLSLHIDPVAWFNPDVNCLIPWDVFVSKFCIGNTASQASA